MTPTQASPQPKAIKGQRVRTGCLTCRRRKKKCDEQLCPETGGCWRCRTAGYECQGFPKVKKVSSSPGSATRHRAMDGSERHGHPQGTIEQLQGSHSPESLRSATAAAFFVPQQDPSQLGAAAALAAMNATGNIAASMASSSHSTNNPSTTAGSCASIGECLLSGQPICEPCLASIQPSLSPAQAVSSPMDLVFASPAAAPTTSGIHEPGSVLQSLIGYYSTMATCWVEGVHPERIASSSIFYGLVRYLIQRIDEDTPLRLSVAAVAACYISGGQLQWPEGMAGIQQWTATLRKDATGLAQCLDAMPSAMASASSSLIDPPAPEASWQGGSSSSSSAGPGGNRALQGLDGDGRPCSGSRSSIDRHLSNHARHLFRLGGKAIEAQTEAFERGPAPAPRLRRSKEWIEVDVIRQHNPLLMATANLAIFAWAEISVSAFFQQLERSLYICNVVLDGVRHVRLANLHSINTIGFSMLVWADVAMAIARGTRPYFSLEEGEQQGRLGPPQDVMSFGPFSCSNALIVCLSDIARLRADCQVSPVLRQGQSRGKPVSLPPHLQQQAQSIDRRLRTLMAAFVDAPGGGGNPSQHGTHQQAFHAGYNAAQGAPRCYEMLVHAASILLQTSVLGRGPLHPVVRADLDSILGLWNSGARDYSLAVGCGNLQLPCFIASSVATEPKDRAICEDALTLVGHGEAAAAAGRKVIREVWRRTDSTGFPCQWFELVEEGWEVAFF